MDRETSLELLNLRELINLLAHHDMGLIFNKGNIEIRQGHKFLITYTNVDTRFWATDVISRIHSQLLNGRGQ